MEDSWILWTFSIQWNDHDQYDTG